ncbi:MAG: ubiquinone biosynthesis protein [Proteobacteria bacterium]|nr:ubiquinone biosynthesis protein [Pseudomonadota bacterium]
MKNCDTLIIGGGAPGLALAIHLAKDGLNLIVADAGAPPAPLSKTPLDSRTVALMGGSIGIIEETGIWPTLKKCANPLSRMAVVDDSRYPAGSDQMVEQAFSASELGRTEFGWNVPLAQLRAALFEAAKKQKNIAFFWNDAFQSAQEKTGGITIHLARTKNISARLLIGTDGRNSPVREAAGIKATRRPYGQKAITCIFKHSRPHEDTSVEFHRTGGPFTFVPMPDKHCSVVWVEKSEDADAFLRLPKQAFTKALEDRTRGRLGKIELVTPPSAWPLEYLRAERLTAPRIALAAEAAHVISPIGAQGLNLSLRDIKTLAEIISSAHANGLDIGSHTTLAAYERARKGDVLTRSLTIDLANQAVASDTPALRVMRRLTLRALSLPGPWRQLVMKKGLAA